MPHTFTELATCAVREVAQRKRVYPRLVEAKRMSQAKADKEIAMMEAIAEHFTKLAAGERLV
jgi:hypothetical protein